MEPVPQRKSIARATAPLAIRCRRCRESTVGPKDYQAAAARKRCRRKFLQLLPLARQRQDNAMI